MPQITLDDQTEAPLPVLPPRRPESHKGDYGRALLIGGSRGMSGAIALAGMAALRGGAGLVTLAVPNSIQNIVAALEPSYMTKGFPDNDGQITYSTTGHAINLTSEIATVVAIGPGLGRSDSLTRFVETIYQVSDKPMVVDADALFALAQHPNTLSNPGGPRVLTPHPGEFSRLTGQTYNDESRVEAVAQFARGEDDLHYKFRRKDETASTVGKSHRDFVVVLKGHNTVVTDGHRYSINRTGNPGMATGGTGDVLTGIITALLCQGLSPFEAARLGVHVHGLTGDLAAEELGQVSLIASDLINYLPKAFRAAVGYTAR
jgi:ADP-dependent NAD(P)H-hydrate dehydratase